MATLRDGHATLYEKAQKPLLFSTVMVLRSQPGPTAYRKHAPGMRRFQSDPDRTSP